MRRIFLLSFLVAMFCPQLAHAQIVEAESMTQPAGSEIQVPLGWASGNQYVTLHEQGTLQTQVTLPQSDLIRVSAREGRDCGDVSMTVRIDGSLVFSASVNGIPFGLYTAPLNLQAGSHSLEIEFPSDTDERCDTTLRVDAASFREVAPPSYRPLYDPLSIFNQPLPASKRTTLSAQFGTNVVAGIRGDSPPINVAPPGTPNRTAVLGSRTTSFPIPSNIAIGTGSDFPTIVRDNATQRELRCWRGTWDGTTLRCEGGGLFHVNSDGAILNPDGSRSLGHAYLGGGAGNGLNYSAGMITMADFLSGSIQHAIRIASGCVSSEFWPPARKSDQSDSGCPPMGQMAYIPDGVACPTSQPSDPDDRELLRQMCAAGRVFGFMRSDGTGADQVVYFEGEASAHWFANGLTGCNASLSCLMRLLPWTLMDQGGRPPSYISWF